jgi:hypothetical protein
MKAPKTSAAKQPPASKQPQPPPGPACAPLKPRPKLFLALLAIFVIWLGILLTLYFRTVYPLRYPSTAATRPGASALPSAPR